MAENSSDLLPWMYGCISEAAFARENDAVTRALQMSFLSVGSGSGSGGGNCSSSSSSTPAASAAAASSLLPPFAARDPSLLWGLPAGRIGKKRKSRTSKRSPTTYITADPANFRELVQQVTGPRSPDAEAGGVRVPLDAPAAAEGTSCLLPTLDTSAFLVERAGLGGPVASPVLADSDPFLVLPSFPTLDSWGVM